MNSTWTEETQWKNKNPLTTPVVEAIVQFKDSYDFTKGGTLLRNCSQSCNYLFQDWYEDEIKTH